MSHKTDGSGPFIVTWQWEFQQDKQRMGWTRWLYFNNESDALEGMAWVRKHYGQTRVEMKKSIGPADWFTSLITTSP